MEFLGTLVAAFAGSVLAPFVSGFLLEKGRNAATRQDVAEITQKVEEVKSEFAANLQQVTHQNSLLIEASRAEAQLRLAAPELRLKAHQEGFALWRKFVANSGTADEHSTRSECDRWFDNNCLFLTADARDAFLRSIQVSGDYRGLRKETSPEWVAQAMSDLYDAGDAFMASVDLPPLRRREENL